MKKFISLFLLLAICFTVSACGKMKITVTDKEGTVSEMTVSELASTKKNEAQFNKLYNGAKATFTGTVAQIETNFTINNGSTVYDSIRFEEGLTLYTSHYTNIAMASNSTPEDIYDYSQINIGDKLTVVDGTVGRMPTDIYFCEKLSKAD